MPGDAAVYTSKERRWGEKHLKGWVSEAYYSSELGLKELGWTGDMFFEAYPGCSHLDGHE